LLLLVGGLLVGESWAAEEMVLLPDDRILVGTIQEIRGDEIKINTGEVQSRYLSTKQAQEKGIWPLKKGDQLHIVVNEQNAVLGYHRVGDPGLHQIIRGRLAQPLMVGQEWAVIQPDGKIEQTHRVRPLIRSKMAAVPIQHPAVFLVDETNQIMDVVFGNEETLRAATGSWHGSPPKGVDRQIRGTIVKPMADHHVTIRTEDGQERAVEVRSFLHDKFQKLPVDKSVILLLDSENKVTDLAIP